MSEVWSDVLCASRLTLAILLLKSVASAPVLGCLTKSIVDAMKKPRGLQIGSRTTRFYQAQHPRAPRRKVLLHGQHSPTVHPIEHTPVRDDMITYTNSSHTSFRARNRLCTTTASLCFRHCMAALSCLSISLCRSSSSRQRLSCLSRPSRFLRSASSKRRA